MKFVFHTNVISPHQLPLARELVRMLGVVNYRYIYDEPMPADRLKLGWRADDAPWIVCSADCPDECRILCETCDFLFSGVREYELFARRLKKGLKTAYVSERWFKPLPRNGQPTWLRFMPEIVLSGRLRMLMPSYWRMARTMARLLRDYPEFTYYGYGVWAIADMQFICQRFGLEWARVSKQMRLWGYYVAPSVCHVSAPDAYALKRPLRVLWVGRFLRWKRVDTLIRAVQKANEVLGKRSVILDLYGTGTEEVALRKMALGDATVCFHRPVGISEVRQLMRTHDVYVLASDGREGWGAVVNEAMEEGMTVLGTHEAGASATLLPGASLFHAGDWKALSSLLVDCVKRSKDPARLESKWTPVGASERLMHEWGRG